MHRLSAILALLLFASQTIAPVLFADGESDLPACCRKDGKHHCSMAAVPKPAPDHGPAFAAPRMCSSFRPGGMAPASSFLDLAAPPAIRPDLVPDHPFVTAQVQAGYRISLNRACQKRGPPSLHV